MSGNKPKDILEENRLDNIARTEEHNWDPDKPARKKPRNFGDKELCHTCRKEFREGCDSYKKGIGDDDKLDWCDGYVKR